MKNYRFCLLLYFFACALTMHAVKALPILRSHQQPDGTTVNLMLHGDASFSYLTTSDGRVVCKGADGGYYYSKFLSPFSMDIVASSQLAHNVESRKFDESLLLSSDEALLTRESYTSQSKRLYVETRSIGSQTIASITANGVRHVPVVLVQFKDVKFSFPTQAELLEYYESFCNVFNPQLDTLNYGSVRDYFIAQSDSIFRPVFDIYGPVTLDSCVAFYGSNGTRGKGGDVNFRRFANESIQKAFSGKENILSQYDCTGDNIVDFVFFIYAGFGEANGGGPETIWPAEQNNDYGLNKVGIYSFTSYGACNELVNFGQRRYNGQTLHDGIGILCHELSHALGMPDLYDVQGSAFGLDYWDLMDSGCYGDLGYRPCGYSAYERDFMGWRQLEELNLAKDVTMSPLGEGGKAYKIVNDAYPDEYYIVENRQNTGWDESLYGHGMLVTHVDYKSSLWNSNRVNVDANHQRVTIIPADNVLTPAGPQSSSVTYSGDTYPGLCQNVSLTNRSVPASLVYNGGGEEGFMNKPITNIEERNGIISFSFMQWVDAISSPACETSLRLTCDDHVLTVENVSEAEVKVYNPSGILVDSDYGRRCVFHLLPGHYVIRSGDVSKSIYIK